MGPGRLIAKLYHARNNVSISLGLSLAIPLNGLVWEMDKQLSIDSTNNSCYPLGEMMLETSFSLR
jgi:hypothetical protein